MPPAIYARQSCDFSRTSQLLKNTEKKDLNNDIYLHNRNIIRDFDKKIERNANFSPTLRHTEKKIADSPMVHLTVDASPQTKKGCHLDKKKSKFYNLISQFYITEKFIQSLFNWTTYRKTKKLKKEHLEVINDLTFYQEGWKPSKFEKNCEKKISLKSCFEPLIKGVMKFMIQKRKNLIFHPTRFFRIFWDCLHSILIVSYLIIIPLEMSFDVNIKGELPSGFYAVILTFFMFDILVNLNTAIYERGNLIFNHRKIMMQYLGSSFLLDGISILYFFDFAGYYNEYLGVLFFLRISTLRKIIKKIQGFFFTDETTYYLLYLIKLILTVLFISHIFSCLWHYVAIVTSSSNKDNWIDYLNLTKAGWKARYVNSFYFVVVVMNTVGFGDIVPRNDWEKIFAIFFIYFACYIFAFSLNIIGIIIQTLNKKSSSLNSALLTLNVYMLQKQIPLDLRVRIRKYLEFLFEEEELQTVEQAHAIINKLSPSLQEEFLLSANGIPLRNIGIFSSLSENSLKQLTLSLREVTLTPGDLLFPPFQPCPSLYIILSGEIELFLIIGGNEKGICKMGNGGVLNEKGFITGIGGDEGGRSLGFSKVMEVERTKFLEIIKNNSNDFERFCVAKENTIFAAKMIISSKKCEGCGEEGHLLWECRWVCLNLRKQGVIARHCWDSGQKRTIWPRKGKKKNCLKLKNKCRSAVKDLRGELFSEEEEEEPEPEQEQEKEVESVDENYNFTKKIERLNSVGNPSEYGILLNQRSFSNDRLSPSNASNRAMIKGKSMIVSQINRQNSGTLHSKSIKSNKSIIKMDGAVRVVSSSFLKEKKRASSHSISERILIDSGSGRISSRTNSFGNQSDAVHEDFNALTFGNVMTYLYLFLFKF